MKLFVLAVTLTSACYAAKLDRGYLPPAGAHTAGGSPGAIQAPGDSPNHQGPTPFASASSDNFNVDKSSGFGSGGGPANYDTHSHAFESSGSEPSSHISNSGSSGFAPQTGSPSFNAPAQRYSGAVAHNGPERPQAASDRAASTIHQDSDVTSNAFKYSFETDNGIQAEESGVATNGVQAQGGFAYKSDNGEVISLSYTADENGYHPHGDHLPTPPPIPEAILRSIEQNARDEAAGISDDGSYKEESYSGFNENKNHGQQYHDQVNGGSPGFHSALSQQHSVPSHPAPHNVASNTGPCANGICNQGPASIGQTYNEPSIIAPCANGACGNRPFYNAPASNEPCSNGACGNAPSSITPYPNAEHISNSLSNNGPCANGACGSKPSSQGSYPNTPSHNGPCTDGDCSNRPSNNSPQHIGAPSTTSHSYQPSTGFSSPQQALNQGTPSKPSYLPPGQHQHIQSQPEQYTGSASSSFSNTVPASTLGKTPSYNGASQPQQPAHHQTSINQPTTQFRSSLTSPAASQQSSHYNTPVSQYGSPVQSHNAQPPSQSLTSTYDASVSSAPSFNAETAKVSKPSSHNGPCDNGAHDSAACGGSAPSHNAPLSQLHSPSSSNIVPATGPSSAAYHYNAPVSAYHVPSSSHSAPALTKSEHNAAAPAHGSQYNSPSPYQGSYSNAPAQGPQYSSPAPAQKSQYNVPTPAQGPQYNSPAPSQRPQHNAAAAAQTPQFNVPASAHGSPHDSPATSQGSYHNSQAIAQNPQYNIPASAQGPQYNSPAPTQRDQYNTPVPAQRPQYNSPAPSHGFSSPSEQYDAQSSQQSPQHAGPIQSYHPHQNAPTSSTSQYDAPAPSNVQHYTAQPELQHPASPQQNQQFGSLKPAGEQFGGPREAPSYSPESGYKY